MEGTTTSSALQKHGLKTTKPAAKTMARKDIDRTLANPEKADCDAGFEAAEGPEPVVILSIPGKKLHTEG
jgi:hypothetical protein